MQQKSDASIGKRLGCFLSNEDLIEVNCCYNYMYLLAAFKLLFAYAFVGGDLLCRL